MLLRACVWCECMRVYLCVRVRALVCVCESVHVCCAYLLEKCLSVQTRARVCFLMGIFVRRRRSHIKYFLWFTFSFEYIHRRHRWHVTTLRSFWRKLLKQARCLRQWYGNLCKLLLILLVLKFHTIYQAHRFLCLLVFFLFFIYFFCECVRFYALVFV